MIRIRIIITLFLVLLTASILFGAANDVTLTVRPDGWSGVMSVEGSGYSTGATYDLDWHGYMRGTITGTFTANETLTQASTGATCKFVSLHNDAVSNRILVQDRAGNPNITNTWTGGTSGATIVPTDLPQLTIPGPLTPYMTVTSMGYTLGVATTKVRTVWITDIVRFPGGLTTATGTWSINGTFTSGTFTDGETITQTTTGCTGLIVGNQAAGGKLYAKILTSGGSVNNSNIWTGGTSGATFTPSSVPSLISQPTNDEKDTDAALNTLVSFSDYVYSKDKSGLGNSGTDPTFTCPTGMIVSGMNSSSARSAAAVVTNNSSTAYQKRICSWSWVPFQRITGSTFRLRCTAWGIDPYTPGKPGIDCVVFSAAEGMNTVTSSPVEWLRIDSTMPDPVKVQEYYADLSSTSLTALTNVACNFIAYPEIGDSGAIYDTSTSSLTPAQLYQAQTLWNDKSGTYASSYAVADSVSGSDPSGFTLADDSGKWVGDVTADPTAGSGTAYASIGHAARATRNRNNSVSSRDDTGGAIIYLKAGNYNYLGRTVTGGYGSTPNFWTTIMPYPGVRRDQVIITGTSGNTDISDKVRIYNCTITSTTNTTFSGTTYLWFDQCAWNSGSASPVFNASGFNYMTHSRIDAFAQGIRPIGNGNEPWPLNRGNQIFGPTGINKVYTVLGNLQPYRVTYGNDLYQDRISTGEASPDPTPILAFNVIKGFQASGASAIVNLGAINENYSGGVVAMNVLEQTNLSPTSSFFYSTEFAATGGTTDNMIWWNNFGAGFRIGFGYNWSINFVYHRRFFSVKNSYWDIQGLKDDSHTTANGIRVGNWPLMWQVGCSGNCNGSVDELGAAELPGEFLGLYSIDPESSTDPPFPQFVDRRSGIGGSTAGAGGGDYHLKKTSPLANLPYQRMLPYDLEGVPVAGLFMGPYATKGSYVKSTGTTSVRSSGSTPVRQ